MLDRINKFDLPDLISSESIKIKCCLIGIYWTTLNHPVSAKCLDQILINQKRFWKVVSLEVGLKIEFQ